MKITLISPYYDITSLGIRIISSCLKNAGHGTQMIFLPQIEGGYQNDFLIEEDERTIRELVKVCADSDLIGITLMTNYFFRVAHLTQRLKNHLSQPIVWGGVHPTIRPEECLQYADMAVISEGEISFVQLCDNLENRLDRSDIKGVWFKKGDGIIKNENRPLIQDLDSLPYPDYNTNHSFILENNSLVPLGYERLRRSLLRGMTIEDGQATYQLVTSRGCPLNCSYCCNDAFRRIHKRERYLRHRTPENVIGELENALNIMDFIQAIWISDDCFIYQSLASLDRFIRLYRKKIALPFFCLGDPAHVTKEKIELLCDGGLKLMTMGIQTGSEKTKKLYKRNIRNDKILKATKTIHQFQSRMNPPIYDIIVDNPYETLEDQFETIKLISRIPKPHYLQLFSLTFFPGSSLYNRAVEEGIIKDDYEEIYNKPYYEKGSSYHNILLRLFNRKIPLILLRILSSRRVYLFLSMKLFSSIYRILDKLRKLVMRNKHTAVFFRNP